eukprot:271366-Pelagomonas_calceolata.AAC.1
MLPNGEVQPPNIGMKAIPLSLLAPDRDRSSLGCMLPNIRMKAIQLSLVAPERDRSSLRHA